MTVCKNCGGEVSAGARICPHCSYPLTGESAPTVVTPSLPDTPLNPTTTIEQPPPAEGAAPLTPAIVKQTDGLAVASLVCGVLGIFTVPVILSIVAIVLARQSKRKIAQSGGALEGEGLAKAGLILGIVGLVLFAILIAFFVLFFVVAVSTGFSDAMASAL